MPVPAESPMYSKVTFLTNTLNKYNNVDYRLRLTMVKPQDAVKFDPSLGVTLAESATTSRFVLTDLEFVQNYSLNPSARTTFMTNGTITVIDPSGLRFMDAIAQTGASLGVTNAGLNCRYLIEIEFVGTLPNVGMPQIDPSRGVFVVSVTGIEVRLTEKGGEFRLAFTGIDGDAMKHVNVTLQQTKTIPHTGHIKSFIEQLQIMLQKEETRKVSAGEQQYENEWHFVLEPFIAGSQDFIFTQDQQNEMKAFTDTTGKPMSGADGSLSSSREGSTIIQVIDNAFADTKAMKFGINNDNSLSDPKVIIDQNTAYSDWKKIKQFWRIDVMVELDTKWDSKTNDYVKKFYYYIYLQDAGDIFFGPVNQLTQEQKDDITATRLASSAYINHLHKRYSYYYTGLNTEILKFDLKAQWGIFIAEHLLRNYSGGSGPSPGPSLTQLAGNALTSLGRMVGVIPQLPSSNAVGQKLTYAEDFITSTTTTDKNTQVPTGIGYSGFIFPHLYSYDNRNTDQGSGAHLPNDDQQRRMKLQHNYDRLSYTGPDFNKIAMTIRGDPYWFGTTKPVFEKGGSSIPKSITELNKLRANFFTGLQKFWIEIDTADYASQTSNGVVNTTYAITGIYTVTQVTNRFSGGRFEQDLVGVRDITVDGPKMWAAMKSADTLES